MNTQTIWNKNNIHLDHKIVYNIFQDITNIQPDSKILIEAQNNHDWLEWELI